MRIVFMGTPDFAVPSLRKLHETGHEVVLVVTQPDRPAGRGRALRSPPVKDAATTLGLSLEQHETVNTDEFAEHLRTLAPDVLVVAAFGQILREDILECPPKGAINIHASILPRFRGVAPINWVIMTGETETGVTTMFMAKKVDAGEIILTRKTPIGDMETAGELYDRLAVLGADLLIETLELVEKGAAPRIAQDPAGVTYARKLRKSDGEMDWSGDAGRVYDHVRGTTPWPGAFTWYRGKVLRVLTAARGESSGTRGEPGEILTLDDERGIEVAVGDGSVWLTRLRPSGKGAMDAASFVRGYRPEVGTRPFVRPGEEAA
ncbi:MAG: methionyl-tRNA formyltransferase [Candidatus Eisenbacteria bacterium]